MHGAHGAGRGHVSRHGPGRHTKRIDDRPARGSCLFDVESGSDMCSRMSVDRGTTLERDESCVECRADRECDVNDSFRSQGIGSCTLSALSTTALQRGP